MDRLRFAGGRSAELERFVVAGDSPWTVGGLGIALSVLTLLAVARLAVELGHPAAAVWAAGLYALSGIALVFAIQPLPAMLASASLAWGLVAVLRADKGSCARSGAWAGLLLGAATFTRAPLLVPSGLLVLWLTARRHRFARLWIDNELSGSGRSQDLRGLHGRLSGRVHARYGQGDLI